MDYLARSAPPDDDVAPARSVSPRLVAALRRVSEALADATISEDEVTDVVTRTVATALECSCVLWRRDSTGGCFGVAAGFDPDPGRLAVLLEALADSHPSAVTGVLASALAAPGTTELVPVDWQDLGGWSSPAAVRLLEEIDDSSLTLVPLRCRYAPPGLLAVRRPSPLRLGELDRVVLEHLGDCVALGADNRRLVLAAGRTIAKRRRAEHTATTIGALIDDLLEAETATGTALAFTADRDGVVTAVHGTLGAELLAGSAPLSGHPLSEAFAGEPALREMAEQLAGGKQLRGSEVRVGDHRLEAWGRTVRDERGGVSGFAALLVDTSLGSDLSERGDRSGRDRRLARAARHSGDADHGRGRDERGVRDHGGVDFERGRATGMVNAARQAALTDLGRWALVGLDFSDLVEDAVEVLSKHLDVDTVHVFEALPDAEFLTLTCNRGQNVASNELLSADPTSSPASFALVSQETVVCEDVALEERFDVPDLWARTNAISVVEVPIPGQESPVGVLGIGRATAGRFADEDVTFVTAVANVLAGAAARHTAERAIRAQALQDPLTGLPNRLLLADHSARFGGTHDSTIRMSGEGRTLLVFDIDRFKEINDTLGHAIGDLVLLEASRRLRTIGSPVELVARLGGDEFALIARSLGGAEAEQRLASRILSVLGEPLDVGGVHLRLRGSIGIASADVGPDGGALDVPSLLRRAEVAMYQAKSEHQGVRRYSDDLERSSLSRLALASELSEAIEHDQLVLDYQPKVLARSGHLTGVEALVRWHHPTRGLLLPDVFVPLAEQTGAIRELTNWALSRALAECASWHRSGWPLPVAVNLSASTVHDPSLLDTVLGATARSGLPTSAIELEVTESAVMRDPEGAMRSLASLAERGVHVALDDFGTGYSSLAYLQRLPVKSVKIDKSFVKPLGTDDIARAIVRAVVDLGHSLHLTVIAEGVDSAAVLDAVQRLGCDAVQGFHVATPMAPQVLQQWLSARAGVSRAGALQWRQENKPSED